MPFGFDSNFHGFLDSVKETQPGGCVDGLAEQAGGKAGVQIEDFTAGDDVACYLDGGGPRARLDTFAGKLEANLDHINGLDDRGGCHAGKSAVDKGEGGAGGGVMEDEGGGAFGLRGGGCCCHCGDGGSVERRGRVRG